MNNIVENDIENDIEYKKMIEDLDSKKNKPLKNLFSFAMYFFVIVFLIPLFIYKKKYYTLLSCYLPNVDLIANVLTWWGGPFNIFGNLYLQNPFSIETFLTQTAINYFALLGLSFNAILRSLKKHKATHLKRSSKNKKNIFNNLYYGWSTTFVMLLMTYLLPSKFVVILMDKINKNINENNVTAIIGLLISASIVGLEYVILEKHQNSLAKFAEKIVKLPERIKLF